jgi:dsRNA-specific ribonuclease
LDDFSADFPAGKVHAFLGKNGSGKSTLVKAISGAIMPSAGALYLDGGFGIAYDWVMARLKDHINPDVMIKSANPKSELQELVQQTGGIVSYRIVGEHGPAHAPHFEAEVLINELAAANACGESKKAAEAAAAAKALEDLMAKEDAQKHQKKPAH